MLENENVVETQDVSVTNKNEQVNNLINDIFGESNDVQDNSKKQEKKQKINAKEIKNTQEKSSIEDTLEQKERQVEKKSIEKDDDDEVEPRNTEIEKLKKALNDSQKWGHTNNRRLKKVAKFVESLKESDILNDEEFDQINELLSLDPEEEEKVENITKSPIARLTQKANKRAGDFKEIYEDDKYFDKKVDAFDHYYNDLSQEEKEDLIEELEKIEDNEFKLFKHMYKLGEKYYESEYKEIEEAGGYKQLLASKNSKLDKMQKKLDILQKKLLQYEDYDDPIYKVEESGDTSNLVKSKNYDSFVEEVFAERDRKKGR